MRLLTVLFSPDYRALSVCAYLWTGRPSDLFSICGGGRRGGVRRDEGGRRLLTTRMFCTSPVHASPPGSFPDGGNPLVFFYLREARTQKKGNQREERGGVWGHEIGHRRSGSDFESNWDRRWWSTLCVRVVVCLCGDHAVKAKARLCDNQGLDLFCFAQQNNPSPKVLECRGRNEGGRKLKKKKRPTAIVWNFSA